MHLITKNPSKSLGWESDASSLGWESDASTLGWESDAISTLDMFYVSSISEMLHAFPNLKDCFARLFLSKKEWDQIII